MPNYQIIRQQIINDSLPVNRLKTLSPGIFRTVDTVSTAITDGKKISFQYIDILPTKEIVLRYDGKEYKVSPQTLVWNDDRYYAPSYSEEKKYIGDYILEHYGLKMVLCRLQQIKDTPLPNAYSSKMTKSLSRFPLHRLQFILTILG